MSKQWTSETIKALLRRARRYTTNEFDQTAPLRAAMIELVQIYWIDSDDGGPPPNCIMRTCDALEVAMSPARITK